MKSIDFPTNWVPDLLPIGSLWLETSATALCGPYVSCSEQGTSGTRLPRLSSKKEATIEIRLYRKHKKAKVWKDGITQCKWLDFVEYPVCLNCPCRWTLTRTNSGWARPSTKPLGGTTSFSWELGWKAKGRVITEYLICFSHRGVRPLASTLSSISCISQTGQQMSAMRQLLWRQSS